MISSKVKIAAILGAVLFLLVGCNPRDKNANGFYIYLVKDLSTTEAMSYELDELPLDNTPVLTDKEIRTYNWSEHAFSMEEGFSLEEKLEGRVTTGGQPFVVMAGNERIYLGSFWTPISSLFIPDIPAITSMWRKGSERETYSIGYGQERDPRGDRRIFEALKELGKIRSE